MNKPSQKENVTLLADFVNTIYPVRQEINEYLVQNSSVINVSKNSLLLRSGDICRHLYLVRKGVLRGYIKDGTKEITTWITAESEIVTSINGFHQQKPSPENIHAIENCELIAFPYDGLQYLYDTYPEANIVGRKVLEQYYVDAEQRAYISRLASARSRYNHFLETKGYLANRIPLKYIASYLNMTIETLSRIRGKSASEGKD
ncbi:MAG: Crp/Fnr family transcriptional regulator [Bacteroidetes bacterium]|nr:Crp/Fnr family transcriptional regulator [Bacteroidota bacterium]